MAEIRVGIMGCGGRMGRMLVAEAQSVPGVTLAGGSERPDSALVGRDLGQLAGLGALGLKASADAAEVIAASDVAIDFTAPAATVAHVRAAAQHSTAMVIGTTGLDPAQVKALETAARLIPIVWAANMSPAVTMLLDLVTETARRLGEDYDIEIVEMHHKHKVDAPSGTALALGEAAAKGRGIELARHSARGRDGETGARKAGDIGFAALRGGDVVGEHTVIFAGEGERLELGHRATSRRIFARGAFRCAAWVVGKPPGLYSMRDVLGLSG
jgi:4-hydroxy-tetrahydrodipicolinate reductase